MLWAKNEQGGLLFGYRKKSGLQVTGFTVPQSSDLASPVIFKRSSNGHAQLALSAWKESGGTVDWIGEWHTHPVGNSAPSTTDIANWVRLAEHVRKPMVFLILSKFGWYVGLQHHSPKRLVPLQCIESNSTASLFGEHTNFHSKANFIL
ncbi:Mov34/MPN/PAD-1 family protein [Thalassospira xiamenensis]